MYIRKSLAIAFDFLILNIISILKLWKFPSPEVTRTHDSTPALYALYVIKDNLRHTCLLVVPFNIDRPVQLSQLLHTTFIGPLHY